MGTLTRLLSRSNSVTSVTKPRTSVVRIMSPRTRPSRCSMKRARGMASRTTLPQKPTSAFMRKVLPSSSAKLTLARKASGLEAGA